MNKTLHNKMQELKSLLDDGILSQEEFDQAKQKILDKWHEADESQNNFQTRPTINLLCEGYELGAADARFELVEKIGAGSYGQVWKAIDLSEKQLTGESKPIKALKFLKEDYRDTPEQIELLQKEANNASKLNHENIVNVTRFVESPDGWVFIVMEFMDGESLDRYIFKKDGKRLPLDEAIHLLKPVAKALDFSHKKGIYHRDLKPANIFIGKDNEVKILDFGLAYQIRRSSNAVNASTESLSGTVEYMAPEVFKNDNPKPAHDIHALAIVMYELVNGKPPFSSEKSLFRKEDDPDPYRPALISEFVWQVMKRGFSHNIDDRPKTAMAFINDVEQAQKSAERRASTERQGVTQKRRVKKEEVNKKPLFIAAISVATIAIIGFSLTGNDDPVPSVEVSTPAPAVLQFPEPAYTTNGTRLDSNQQIKQGDTLVVPNNEIINVSRAFDDQSQVTIPVEVDIPVNTGNQQPPQNDIPKPVEEPSELDIPTTGFSIQILSIGSKSVALNAKQQMIDRGYSSAFLQPFINNGENWYRVRVGSYSEFSEAKQVLQSIKTLKLKNIQAENAVIRENAK